jgi:manganese oxidase
MAVWSRRAVGALTAFVALVIAAAGATSVLRRPAPDPTRIVNSDLREPAGRLAGGVLSVQLEARAGDWRPDGEEGPVLRVAAFAAEGGSLQVPGPVLRMASGTEVSATVTNLLDVPLMIYGLGAERGVDRDSTLIQPQASHEFRFTAGEPGVYYYAGRTTEVPNLLQRFEFDGQLNGALVIDGSDAPSRPRDRIFMITGWFTLDSTSVSGLGPNPVLAINGRMWPHTEVVEATQGDSLHWRWINVTDIPHPMHLHGFYFRVDARGDHAHYGVLPDDERYLAVTELLLPGATLALTWSPDRPGNWVFHCHFAGHMASELALNQDRRHPFTIAAMQSAADARAAADATAAGPSAESDPAAGAAAAAAGGQGSGAHAGHAQHDMSGLVLGIRVRQRGRQAAAPPESRSLRLLVRSQPEVWGAYTGYSFVLGGSPQEADPAALTIPGPLLVLQKDERVAVTIINQSHEPAAVHWHGIELESFPDGVPGWSGSGKNVLPLIAPMDSFTVRFTPPRAGTFMYHSHFNEMQQISSGMYGAIVVLDPGERYDPQTDRILLFSDGGPIVNLITGPFPALLLNGVERPEPLELQAGVRYRFRLVNILSEGLVAISLLENGAPTHWRTIARDGADLPPSQARLVPAELMFASGTIHDVEFIPARAGELTLRFGVPPVFPDVPPPVDVKVVVRGG